jgi:hypothetical protein
MGDYFIGQCRPEHIAISGRCEKILLLDENKVHADWAKVADYRTMSL